MQIGRWQMARVSGDVGDYPSQGRLASQAEWRFYFVIALV